VLALSLLVAIVGSVPFLLVNLGVQGDSYPPLWRLVLASVDAGVQEEIFSRLFLMTLLAWLGGLVWRDKEGRPTRGVLWAAIILAGLLFGWGHVDEHFSNPEIRGVLVTALLVNTALGIAFGWLYWKQGLESAILAHLLVDAVGSAVVVPAYLSDSVWLGLLVLAGLIAVAGLCWRWLAREGVEVMERGT
jgi:membrane protease YdiL (CAAX protease family)